MRRLAVVLAVVALAVGACRIVPVDQLGTVGWSHAFLVLPAPGSPAVLYLRAENPTAVPDTLTAVRVTGADSAQVHRTMAMGNGMEQMAASPLLPLAAHDSVVFAPGGLHVMVFGVPASLRAGDSVSVAVRFRGAGEVTHWARVITYAQVDSALGR